MPMSYKGGVQRKLSTCLLALINTYTMIFDPSCLQRHDELGSATAASNRTHNHTNALVEAYSLINLWSDYGIVGDVTVSFANIISTSRS